MASWDLLEMRWDLFYVATIWRAADIADEYCKIDYWDSRYVGAHDEVVATKQHVFISGLAATVRQGCVLTETENLVGGMLRIRK